MAERRVWDPSAGSFGALTMGLYRFAAVELALIVATVPTWIAFMFLDRHPSNIPLYAVFALPVGPAIQAAVYAFRSGSDGLPEPWRRFWRGWRTGLKQSLVVWTPAVVLGGLTLMNLAYADAAAVAFPLVIAGLVLAGVVAVISVAALTVIATFTFRTRDLAKVTIFGLGSRPMSAIGVLAVAFLAGVLLVFTFDAVLLLLAALFCFGLLATARPMLAAVQQALTDTAGSSIGTAGTAD
ncbi:MAG: DUF624 domain-containing protein [Demequina sp.]